MVPAITMLVDSHEHLPYEFEDLVRIAGTIRQTLPAGDYAIAEAPEIFCVERRRVEEFNTIFSNPSDNRSPFLQESNRSWTTHIGFWSSKGHFSPAKAVDGSVNITRTA